MGKGSGGTRYNSKSAHKAYKVNTTGDISAIGGGTSFANMIQILAQQYGLNVDLHVKPTENGPYASASQPKDGNVVITLNREMPKSNLSLPYNVGANDSDINSRMEAVAAHEIAHQIVAGFEWHPSQFMSWDDFKTDERKRGFKVAEAKQHYESALQRREQAYLRRANTARKRQMIDELAKVESEYRSAKRSEKGISGYAQERNKGEFIAEAFAYAKTYGKGKNEWADRVVDIIDKYAKIKR